MEKKTKPKTLAHQYVEKCVSISAHTSDFLYLSGKERGWPFFDSYHVVSTEHWGIAHTGRFQGQEQQEMMRGDQESPRGGRQGFGGAVSSPETPENIFVLVKAYLVPKANYHFK